MANSASAASASQHHRRGLAHAHARRLDLAIHAFASALQLDPHFAAAYIDRGVAHAQRGEFRQALADLNQGLALAPNHPTALLARGMVHFELQALEPATADLTAARVAAPNDADICFQRGLLYLARGDCALALSDFADATRLDPSNARLHNQLAWILSTHPDGRFRDGLKALEHATKACELTQWQDALILDTLAAAHAEIGGFDQAARRAAEALRIAPHGFESAISQRFALYQSGQAFRDAALAHAHSVKST
jgi:tetratricopeptide (TPR) repeat protein